MIILAILAACAAIAALCWLLFTLAVFALPAMLGVMTGIWAYHSGAGFPGALVVGVFAATLTLAGGHLLLALARPTWLKAVVAALFVVPAAVAGFHATHGIVKHLIPSETWQISFSVVGAIAVGLTALARLASFAAAPVHMGGGTATPYPPDHRDATRSEKVRFPAIKVAAMSPSTRRSTPETM